MTFLRCCLAGAAALIACSCYESDLRPPTSDASADQPQGLASSDAIDDGRPSDSATVADLNAGPGMGERPPPEAAPGAESGPEPPLEPGFDAKVEHAPDAGSPCTYNGQVYEPGQSFTSNCIRYTCVGDTHWTSSGSACTDAPSEGSDLSRAYISDATNYKIVNRLSVPRITVKAGADLRVCWTDLSTDLRQRAISPTNDIDHVGFGQIKGPTEAEIEQQLAAGTFDDRKLTLYRDFIIPAESNTCAQLSQFKLGGSVLDPATDLVPVADTTHLLMWGQGLDPGVGVKTLAFLEPDPTSTVTEVTAPPGKGILSFRADLTTPQKVSIPASGPWIVDWSGLTKDGLGQAVDYSNLDSILLGHYDMTVAELESRCLDYDLIATALYRASIPVGMRSIDLAATATEAGMPFNGFAPTDGVWAVALVCSRCQIPAPAAVSVLDPV